MEQLKRDLLPKFKTLKGIQEDPSDLDDVLSYALELAIEQVLAFCNLETREFPQGLVNTVLLMANDLLEEVAKLSDPQQEEQSSGQDQAEIKSIKEGDFTITYATSAETRQRLAQATHSLFGQLPIKYRTVLIRYRKMV